MTTVINKELGQNRGVRRLWLQGKTLDNEGLTPGTKLVPTRKGRKLLLKVAANDDLETKTVTISSKKKNGNCIPIFDYCNSELSELFPEGTRVRITVTADGISVICHHQAERIEHRNNSTKSKLMNGAPLRVCSVFAGGMVLDNAVHSGLAKSGIDTEVAMVVEREHEYLECARRNNNSLFAKDCKFYQSEIQHLNIGNAQSLDIDLVVAGIPCTGSSLSGRAKLKLKHAESHPEAGAMFFYFLAICDALSPSMILIENVESYKNTASMDVIRSVLDTLGYDVLETILDGSAYALENRQRLCAIAVSRGLSEIDTLDVTALQERPRTIGDILDNVDDGDPAYQDHSYLVKKAARDKLAGKGFKQAIHTASDTHVGCIGKGYNRRRSTEPFFQNPSNPALTRLFTVNEHCSLKGIPPHLVDGLSVTKAHEVLGQSVVYPAFEAVSYHLGCFIRTEYPIKLAA
ncbi:DNA cytosine methyltransferase [Enterovibrio norvegicus]|uniref:DNA cytosine methyltransferase n=1 Tax=Enterovibrio norvegicus TaxID=188144 RepID=UPI00352FE784